MVRLTSEGLIELLAAFRDATAASPVVFKQGPVPPATIRIITYWAR